jgi:biotin synthase-like enzyme
MGTVLLINYPEKVKPWATAHFGGVPTQTAYLAAILEKNKIDYKILDLHLCSLEEFGMSKHNQLLDITFRRKGRIGTVLNSLNCRKGLNYLSWLDKKIKNEVSDADFLLINGDVLAVSMSILRMAKSANKKIKSIVGGWQATLYPGSFFQGYLVDFVCRGYGDNVLATIIHKSIGKNACRETRVFASMDIPQEVLTPDYSQIKLKNYFKYFSHVNLVSSFGCPSKCHFCFQSALNHSYVTRDCEELMREIRRFEEHGIHNFMFSDACMNGSVGHLRTMANTFIKENVSIRWTAQFRAQGLNKEMVRLLARAGCISASFGIETPNQQLNKLIGKSLDIKEAGTILRNFRSAGILTRGTFMYDLPGESLSDFFSCFRFKKNNRTDFCYFYKLSVYPTTGMDRNASLRLADNNIPDQSNDRIRNVSGTLALALKDRLAHLSNRMSSRKFSHNNRLIEFFYSKHTNPNTLEAL